MKFFKLGIISSALLLLLTGCNIDSQSPEQLIKHTPVYDKDNYELYKQIEKTLPNTDSSLILPGNSREVGKINRVDLNKDGLEDVVVLRKKSEFNEQNKKDEKNQVGFTILTKGFNGKYIEKDTILEEGNSISYINFYDLDSDGIKEIVLVTKSDEKSNLHIYEYQNDKIQKNYTLNPTWINNHTNFTDIKVVIDYIDEDDTLDMLILNYDQVNSKVYINLCNYNGILNIKGWVSIDDVKNLDKLYIKIGNIDKYKKGIIIDYQRLKDNNYNTQLLYIDNDNLKKVFENDYKELIKPYYIEPEDIDNDKIIEIPKVSGDSSIYNLNSAANVNWYKWNGKIDKEASVVFVNQVYYNYTYNYKFLVPNNLVNKLHIEQESKSESAVFKFYYFDNSKKVKNLFTLVVLTKNSVEGSKNQSNKASVIVGENYDFTFNLFKEDIKELDRLGITTEKLIDCFSLIY